MTIGVFVEHYHAFPGSLIREVVEQQGTVRRYKHLFVIKILKQLNEFAHQLLVHPVFNLVKKDTFISGVEL